MATLIVIVAHPDLAAKEVLGFDYVCKRPGTVAKLAKLVDDEWVVHVRGTPATGKTTLALLLRQYYKNRGNRVVFFTGPNRQSGDSLDSYLAKKCELEGYFGVQLDWLTKANIIFIIDEAQTAYHDRHLWDFIKLKRDYRTGPKFCIFTVYGSPSQGLREVTDPTPDTLRMAKQVSMLLSHGKDSPDIRLFYDDSEFKDVVARFCADPAHLLPLEETAWTYLSEITNCHPGAVYSILFYLHKVIKPQLPIK
jgi:hypothetical protein